MRKRDSMNAKMTSVTVKPGVRNLVAELAAKRIEALDAEIAMLSIAIAQVAAAQARLADYTDSTPTQRNSAIGGFDAALRQALAAQRAGFSRFKF